MHNRQDPAFWAERYELYKVRLPSNVCQLNSHWQAVGIMQIQLQIYCARHHR